MAVVWGPLAGYFAKRYDGELKLVPVEPEVDPPGLPFTFSISLGVRKGNITLRNELEHVLTERQQDIQKVLSEYGVPELPVGAQEGRSRAE
jgi:hypothetical protein